MNKFGFDVSFKRQFKAYYFLIIASIICLIIANFLSESYFFLYLLPGDMFLLFLISLNNDISDKNTGIGGVLVPINVMGLVLLILYGKLDLTRLFSLVLFVIEVLKLIIFAFLTIRLKLRH